MEIKETPTPELDRMLAVKEQSQAIGEFLDWLENHDSLKLCRRGLVQDDAAVIVNALTLKENIPEDDELKEGYVLNMTPIEKILAEYFNIDLAKIEQERRAILDSIRNK